MSYTQRLTDLPHPRELYGRARALAVIETAINARPFLRWHTLDSGWRRLVRISSGSGDEACVWLTDAGCVVRGFDHESELSPWVADERRIWPGLLDGFREELDNGPTLNIHEGVEDLTFVLWWHGTGPWETGNLSLPIPGLADMDGSHLLLNALVSDEAAAAFLSYYYENQIPEETIGRIPPGATFDTQVLAGLPNLRPLDVVAEEYASVGIRLLND